ncbi:hypothetical protein BASA81_002378 [Batrachochytrium salamandrivorans]|nr:hypothetical protein BASA81_002378 [Batrachochytrium salamandrivorans]
MGVAHSSSSPPQPESAKPILDVSIPAGLSPPLPPATNQNMPPDARNKPKPIPAYVGGGEKREELVRVGFGPLAWINNSTRNSRRVPLTNFSLLARLPVNREGDLVRRAGWWGKEAKVHLVVKSCYALVFTTSLAYAADTNRKARRRSFNGRPSQGGEGDQDSSHNNPEVNTDDGGDDYTSAIPDRVFVLRGATVNRPINNREEFDLKCADGTHLHFKAEDAHSRDAWVASLDRAVRQGDAQLSDFESYAKLARGHFGSVQLVKHLRTQTALALKTIEMKPKRPEKQYHERAILELLQSGNRGANPFVAKLCFAFRDSAHLYLCTELASGGDLWALLRKTRRLSESACRFISGELVLAVRHVHSHGVLHRDIKLENLLLDGQGHVKLVDFGLSKRLFDPESGVWDGRTFTVCGTNYYMPPEMLVKSNPGHSLATDWWQVGCLIYELMAGVPAFYEKGAKNIHKKILDTGGAPPFPSNIREPPSRACVDIVAGLLVHEPLKRLGRGSDDGEYDIKTHAFYKQMNFVNLFNLRFPVPEEILRYLRGDTPASNTPGSSQEKNEDEEDGGARTGAEDTNEEGIIRRAFPESELFDRPKRSGSLKYRKIRSLPSITARMSSLLLSPNETSPSSFTGRNGIEPNGGERRTEPLVPVDLGPYLGYEFAVDDNLLADAKRGSGLHLSRWRGGGGGGGGGASKD